MWPQDDEDRRLWLAQAVLEFATIAGFFATLFGLHFLSYALNSLPM